MTQRRAVWLLLVVVGLALAGCLEASAASLTVSPLRLYLSPQNARGVITVHNPDDSPVLVQAEVFLWSQEDGKNRLTAAPELIVVPPVFELRPDGEQVLRVGFRKPPNAESEQSYRLILSQVPDQTDPASGVTVLLRLSLPIFLTPPDAAAKPGWSAVMPGARDLRLELDNQGLAHLRVTGIRIFSSLQDQAPLAEHTTVAYVLAGSKRQWTLPLSVAPQVDRLILQATTNLGELQEILPIRR